jgi:hypothetical protein
MLGESKRNIKISEGGTIFNRTQQCLAYADDTDLVSRTQGFLKGGFIQLEEESRRIGLKVNEEKSKYMATSGQKERLVMKPHIKECQMELQK